MKQQDALNEISLQRIYHIVFPTYKRLPILLNDEYRNTVVNIIKEYVGEQCIKVITYKVLTDHVHLLIQKETNQLLPYIIQGLKGNTTYLFYKTYPEMKLDIGRAKLWARGYHQTLIQSAQQLKNTINYINTNYDCYKDDLFD
jgi:REP element-mobilizing transposase RayT